MSTTRRTTTDVPAETPARATSGPPASHLPRRPAAGRSIGTASTTAGVGLLLMSAFAVFGKVFVIDSLVTPGNATQTAQDILASEGLFRLGIVSLILVLALDVVVACALYWVFSPVNKSLSIVASAMRLVYSAVFMVAIAQLPGVLRLLSDEGNRAVFSADQVNAQASAGLGAFT